MTAPASVNGRSWPTPSAPARLRIVRPVDEPAQSPAQSPAKSPAKSAAGTPAKPGPRRLEPGPSAGGGRRLVAAGAGRPRPVRPRVEPALPEPEELMEFGPRALGSTLPAVRDLEWPAGFEVELPLPRPAVVPERSISIERSCLGTPSQRAARDRRLRGHAPRPVESAPLRLTLRGRVVFGVLAMLVVGILAGVSYLNQLGAGDSAAQPPASVVVRPGDTLFAIAHRIAPDKDPREVVADLREANGLGPAEITSLVPGETLIVSLD